MSNYLSQEYRIQQPQSNVDINVVDKTLSTLQNKFDANSALIQQTLGAYSSKLQALRPLDQEYISARMKEVTSAIDSYKMKNGNLAYNSTRDSILTAITSIVDDPIVQDAITSTQNKQAYDTEYQNILKKNPELANSANYQYGMYSGGYYDYMQGKTKKLGAMQYQPYVDVTEENLKALKTIKDIKGKRFMEMPDPNNPGQIVRKEIDGLEDWEISQYLGSTMTAPQVQQMKINAWQKSGGINIESNRPIIEAQYNSYKAQKIDYLNNQKQVNDAIINNSSYSDNQRQEAKRKSAELTESINTFKAMDSSKLDTTTIASTLDRQNYLNGISQLAQAEWSTEYKKDDVYFENQKLDIDRQKLALDTKKFELDQFKEFKKAGVDASGNPVGGNSVISSTPMESVLAETISAENAGQDTLVKEHNRAYNNILKDASNFMQTATDEDVNTVKAELNLRGVEVVGNQFRFKNPSNNLNNSLANTVYESFKKTGQTTPEMYKNNEVKRQKSQELLTVRRESLPKVFNENPDTYINSLRTMIEGKKTGKLIDYYDAMVGRPISSDKDWKEAAQAEEYVKRNGGWANLKSTLQSSPEKLLEFSEILSEISKGAYNVSDLKKDASSEIEKTIQSKTSKGVMMSAYNQFNIIDDDVRENVLKSVVSNEVTGGSDFDPKQNVTIRKRGEDVFIEQLKSEGTGKNAKSYPLSYKVNKVSSLYNQLSNYINLDATSNQNYIQASKDTKIPPIKVSIPSYSTSRTGQQTMAYKVENYIPASAKKAFGVVNFQPGRLATKELASEEIVNRLVAAGVSKEKATIYKNTALNNLDAYQIKTVVKPNPNSGFKNEFAIEVLDNNNKRISDSFLGTDKLSYDLKYSIEMYPQVYVLNQLLYSALVNKNNIDEEINKL